MCTVPRQKNVAVMVPDVEGSQELLQLQLAARACTPNLMCCSCSNMCNVPGPSGGSSFCTKSARCLVGITVEASGSK